MHAFSVVRISSNNNDYSLSKGDLIVNISLAHTATNANCWGANKDAITNRINTINVLNNKKNVIIPFSAYSDLANIVSVTLSGDRMKFIITIIGGDASSSFTASICFNECYIVSRKVKLNEFPDDRYEETKYSFNTSNN